MEILVCIMIIVGVLLWFNYVIAKQFYDAAVAKGYGYKKYLWFSFFLGIVGYLMVIALPDRKNHNK